MQLHSRDWSLIVFPVRLQSGASSNKGQVEVFHDGQWGSICDDGWDDDDATVACRSLGFGYGEAFEDTTFGESEGPIWLDDVDCSGYEQNLAECRLLDWGVHDCYGWERASVRCFWKKIPWIWNYCIIYHQSSDMASDWLAAFNWHHFPTWLLISWQQGCQPIRRHVRKWPSTSRDFNNEFCL